MKPYAEMTREELASLKEQLIIQYKEYQGKGLSLNMARGKPCIEQLDLSMGMMDSLSSDADMTCEDGTDCRNYGVWNGLPEMRAIFSEMMDVPADQIILGNNSSLQMMFDCIAQGFTHGYSGCTPWARQEKVKFLCPAPGYDRHFAVTEYFGFEMIPVPMLKTGPDMDIIERLVAQDDTIKGCWCVPKYSNPTGITYSDETVRRFAALKPAAKDFRIMWDNAYCVHDVTDTPDTLLDLYAECLKNGTEDNVLFFASTSKISFPGAGVAALAASKRNIEDLKRRITTQTIGPDKLNQLRHILFLHDINGVHNLMQGHRKILEPKFQIVEESLERELGDLGIAKWSKPNGGYFVSVQVLDGCAKRVVQLCKEAGVQLTSAGAAYPYGKDPRDSNIRVAPTYPPVSELEIAMDLFCLCTELAAVEKLLETK